MKPSCLSLDKKLAVDSQFLPLKLAVDSQFLPLKLAVDSQFPLQLDSDLFV
ncbi:MAG TPA: hypothetical protein GXX65_10270 [Methanosarcina sp.]|nr:hypothetical protein [Methanosarcina sp.]